MRHDTRTALNLVSTQGSPSARSRSAWLQQLAQTRLESRIGHSTVHALADRVLLIEDGRIALDERVRLPRPRSRGNRGFAAIEDRVVGKLTPSPASFPCHATRPPALQSSGHV